PGGGQLRQPRRVPRRRPDRRRDARPDGRTCPRPSQSDGRLTMFHTTIKGLLARKLRLVTTGVAVLLGVAFMTGTLVLTATVGRTFDNLFASVYEHTDAVVRAHSDFSQQGISVRGRIDASLLPTIAAVPGVAA